MPKGFTERDSGEAAEAAGETGRREGGNVSSIYSDYAESRADRASEWTSEDGQTDAIGEGLSAIAYALLDVAAAIREHTSSRE